MDFLKSIGEIPIILYIFYIGIIIALIVAVISTATNTKNTDKTMDNIEKLLENDLQKQNEILNCLIRMEQQNTKYYNTNYTQLNKIIEQNSRNIAEQEEKSRL